MYIFALFALPLAFLSSIFQVLSKDQRARSYRMLAQGALFGVPALVIYGILGFLYGPAYGSWLVVVSFLLGTFLVPFAFAFGAVALTFGTDPRRTDIVDISAFVFGFMSVFAGRAAIASAGIHNHVFAFYLPVWLVAFTVYFPHLWIDALHEGFPGAIKRAAQAIGLLLPASVAISLGQTRHEFLCLLAFLASSGGTGFLAFLRWKKLVRFTATADAARTKNEPSVESTTARV